MKNKDVIQKILNYHPPINDYIGCDGYKCGNPEAECSGVVSALVPTVEVIRKTADLGCNLMIVHEPISYQTPDYPNWRGTFPNQVYEQKQELLDKYGITVWRDHDHIHTHQPDGIFSGVLKYLGWESYYAPMDNAPPLMFQCNIPEMTVAELRQYLMEKLGLNGLRYIGKPEDRVSRIGLCAHLYPGAFGQVRDDGDIYADYATMLIGEMEKENGIQVLIPGEIIEWDILSYIRDAVALGQAKACMNIGHFNLEELGMRYAADWIRELIEYHLPVHYVPTGDIFRYI